MSNSLFNPKKYGFKNPLDNSAFLRKHGKISATKVQTNPCDSFNLSEGLKKAKEKKEVL